MCRKSQLLFFPLTKKFIRAFENSLCPVIFKKSIFARSNAEEGGGGEWGEKFARGDVEASN